jgi:hypothetical protein
MIEQILKIAPILKLLWPKSYNRITWLIITFALPLTSKPIWIEIVNIFLPELELQIIGKYDWVIGFLLILISLIYNVISRYHELKYSPVDSFAFERVKFNNIKSFSDLAQEILPILKENEYIFKNLGPNSNFDSEGKLRTDLTLWHKKKVEIIQPNNNTIKELLVKNKNIIPVNTEKIVDKMKMHIDAFNEHLQNSEFEYSSHQFPVEFQQLILSECKSVGYDSQIVNKSIKWLSKKIDKLEVEEWFLFGSILLYPKKSLDADIVILTNKTLNNQEVESLKLDYKLKFNKDLDITIFHKKEYAEFEKFKMLNLIKK